MTYSIPFNVSYVSGKEREYIDEVFLNGHFSGNGPFTKRVEEKLEKILGSERVLLTHSCTAALEMSSMVLGLGPGDEVLMPSFTFVTTASSIMRSGATPVFCEVDENMLIDLDDMESKITERTKAIIPVHYAGSAPHMDRISSICDNRSLFMIEDSAQGLGSTWNSKALGTFGKFGAISFHETKNIHSGLGGCLIINDESLVEKSEMIWERGTDRSAFFRGQVDKYSWREVGSSFYPSELQAAFLLAQLESFEENMKIRKKIWNHYIKHLAPLENKYEFRILRPSEGSDHNYHMVAIVLKSPDQADFVREYLCDKGIQAVIHYVPLHSSPVGRSLGYSENDLPNTLNYSRSLLRLPLHYKIDSEDVNKISSNLEQCLQIYEG
jgi:dTDP-4-amino-4,6-dideoxygalactose transaminase